MNQIKIGKFIAECRKNKKLTQEELASKLNVSSKSVSRWENGRTMPDYSILKLLCDNLDITVNELLSGEKENNNYDENLYNILKEYYKLKKQKNIIKNTLIILSILFLALIVRIIIVGGIVALITFNPYKNISGIENYNKEYYIKEYKGDLDSNLSIFPNDTFNLINPTFYSSFKVGLFDTDGYIVLDTKYNENDFNNEINRLSNLNMIISNCNGSTFTNYIKYDENSYQYPAYITIDGFSSTYEYALIDKDNLNITYVYLSYPNVSNIQYNKYLKKDKSEYSIMDTLNKYSMYNHSFDNNNSFNEFDDCSK